MNTSLENITISQSDTRIYDLSKKSGDMTITVDANSAVNLFFLVYDAAVKVNIILAGSHSSVACSAVVLSSKGIVSMLDISASLQVSDAKADLYALSLLGDNAKATVNGGVVIQPGILRTEWYLSEENLLLGKKISIKSLPMLDVRSNDVKASHGAKIDRLDPQKLFYLTAKWLPMAQAEQLMISSYIQKALDHAKIDNESIFKHILSIL